MESNPYSSPSANLFGSTGSTLSEAVSQGTISQLQGTKPWVRFMAVLLFLGGIMMVGLGLIMGVATGMGGMALPQGQAGNPFGGASMVVIGVVYSLMGLLYLYPAVKLWKYGTKIGDLIKSRSVADLEAALNEQRIVWKFWGVMTIIIFVLAFAGAIVGAIVGVMAAGAMKA
ncbi:MAG: DUF5362 family protein [Prosthecobacter sp.]|nr:DUF5362 family protein [Prosthecobacter sp.]